MKKCCSKTASMDNSDVKGPLTVWHSLNEIIPVFIWVTTNYTASNKPLWPHILALTRYPQKKPCAHAFTDETTRPHMPTTNTKWMCARLSFPQVFTSTHALYCIDTCSSYVKYQWESARSVSILTSHAEAQSYIICLWSWNGAISVIMWLCKP